MLCPVSNVFTDMTVFLYRLRLQGDGNTLLGDNSVKSGSQHRLTIPQFMFLAHLSQRLWISYCDCSPAVIRPSSIQVRTTSLKPLGQFLTLNQWVLSIVERGYKISFKEHPLLSYKPVLIPQTERKELEDVNSLHQKRTVAETSTKSSGFYSRINLVHRKKKKCNMRLIIDFSILNKFILLQGFKIETQKVRNAIL